MKLPTTSGINKISDCLKNNNQLNVLMEAKAHQNVQVYFSDFLDSKYTVCDT
jgi:hypothetical protein